jgi:uncharacterized protein (DUF1330 family)
VQAVPVTLCVLLVAATGQEAMLGRYEDQVLALLGEHDARVLTRLRALEGSITEIQILEFPSEQALASFQSDPRRLALGELRDAAIATGRLVTASGDRAPSVSQMQPSSGLMGVGETTKGIMRLEDTRYDRRGTRA